jgi:uncharacterized protein
MNETSIPVAEDTVDFKIVFEALPGRSVLIKTDSPAFTILAITEEILQLKTPTLIKKDLIGKKFFEAFPQDSGYANFIGKNDLRKSFDHVIAHKGNRSLRIFYRRLLVLLIIGFLHCYFLWDGDILLLYALIGLVLPLFRNCSDKTLLVWAFALIISPLFIDLVKLLLLWSPGDFLLIKAQAIDVRNKIPLDDSFALYLYKEGSGMQEWQNWRESGIFYRYQYILDSNRIPKVLGMFLLGLYAGRKSIYQRLQEYQGLFKKLRFWGFLIGLPASIAMVYFLVDGRNIYKSFYGLLDTLFYAISVVPLSLAYLSSICLFWIKRKEKNPFKIFAPVGRMALTNYILQTIFGIIIFYGVGFGLGTQVGPAYIFPIAIGIFILQIVFSTYWFKYFRYGPLEWVWRQLTYGKRLPFRK